MGVFFSLLCHDYPIEMKYLFLVQGEGRGHMTQAIVLSEILTRNGHEVVYTFVGQSSRREIPNYFFERMHSEVEGLQSPNFVLDKANKSLRLWKSIIYNAGLLPTFRKSLKRIHEKILETRPDVLINFYDFLGGFYFRFYYPTSIKHVCVGRQFLTHHPDYPFAPGQFFEKKLFLLNNAVTGQRCAKFLALSFRDYDPPKVKNMVVMPPLLKAEIKKATTAHEDFILGYMVNDGYAEELINWHLNYKSITIHCFWDRRDMPKSHSPHACLTFHQLDNVLFNDMMRRCKGFITTAGFESICEAMYLQKPVLMIPVASQYEQACNAIDAVNSGAGVQSDTFNVSILLEFMEHFRPNANFRQWAAKTEIRFLEELTNL
jgi:uncharacterized protein (TIGR00661 family)